MRAVIAAYNNHHHLVLRPDDVWFAVLVQLSIYVNNHAEELRDFFVPHGGRDEIVLDFPDSNGIDDIDFASFARRMTCEVCKRVNDPELRDWVLPSFTTTTHTDEVVGSILMLGALQKYFSFAARTGCGIPSVTLEGTREDWQSMLDRLEKLSLLGPEAAEFQRALKPIFTRFVGTFDHPDTPETHDFWWRAVDATRGSGVSYLSGWILAFAFWDKDGNARNLEHTEELDCCCLDDVHFGRMKDEHIPNGYSTVPVRVFANGKEFETLMVAGSVGVQLSSSNQPIDPRSESDSDDDRRVRQWDTTHRCWRYRSAPARALEPDSSGRRREGATVFDTVKPLTGWWIIELEESAPLCQKDVLEMKQPAHAEPCARFSLAEAHSRHAMSKETECDSETFLEELLTVPRPLQPVPHD